MEESLDAAGLVRAWAENGCNGTAVLRPEQDLLAEHLLMRSVMAAMRAEGQTLRNNEPLRPHFWSGVVDFIGNFVHYVHRTKEEGVFFPMLVSQGLIDAESKSHLHAEHSDLKGLTLQLCDGVNDADWERTMRVVSRYLDLVTQHLDSEERHLDDPVVRELPAEQWESGRKAFAAIEDSVFSGNGRAHYLDLTQSLCGDVGLAPVYAAPADVRRKDSES